ncbi:GNAT family N-acetyltransferase [Actinoplanes sp. NPDC051411]|uniref:GNAT family N-acetyltransferase n=1 Tax=Actinoplanes sp. NPDC051411 TaxID=3155522 RepID=UPI00344956BB
MRISTGPLDSPDDAFDIVCSCQEFDQPDLPALPREAFLAALDNPWPGLTYERYLARAGDTPVGYLVLGLPQHDNRTLVEVELRVLPRERRRGAGQALLDLARERARALGRRHLVGMSVQSRPDGSAFAEAVGARVALQQIRCRLDLQAADQGRLDALLAEAWKHAAGYELVQWVGVPPDEIIDDVATVANRLNVDSPIGDLPLEPERLDADQIRRAEASNVSRGRETINTGVRRNGRLVGWTAIAGLLAEPQRAWQQITLVLPEDRGHRLGMVLKLENLRLVRDRWPALRYIDTFNALSNEHMLAINRQIGFAPAESVIQWRLDV